MRRSLLNKQILSKSLRQALVLFTMLLLPSAAWGEDYNITVAGIPVTSDNATNISGDQITGGKVSFTPAEGDTRATLTLDNARVNGTVSTSLTELNVHLKGHSVFNVETNNDNKTYLIYGSGQSLILHYSAESFGDVLEGIGTANNYKLEVDNATTTTYDEGYWENSFSLENEKDYCKVSKPYLYVYLYEGGTEVDKSNNSSFNEIEGFNFDAENSSLTISKTINYYNNDHDYFVKSNIANLTVNITDNIYYGLNTYESTTDRGKVFIYTGNEAGSTLTLNIAEGKILKASWTGTTSGNTEWINSGFSKTNFSTNLSTMESSGLYAEEIQESNEYSIVFSNVELYDLSVAGTRVNSINKGNLLNDANSSVSFTPAEGNTPAKLTLNKAGITVDGKNAIESGLDNLTVYLVGDQNNIVCQGSNDFAFKGTKSGAKVTFATNAKSPGKLTGQVPETRVFDGITREYQGLSYNRNGDSFTISATDYGISIGGVAITSACVGDDGTISGVEGITSGTVKFTPADATTSTPSTLTLEGATVTGPILSSNNLEIALKGTNTITSTDSATVIRSLSKDVALTFSKLGDTSLSVTHVDQGSNAPSIISGFTSIDYTTAGLYMQSSVPTKYESVNIAPLEADKTINSLVSAIDNSCIHSATITSTQTYPLWVAGTQVTASNYENVLGNETKTVSFDGVDKLTLSEAIIDCQAGDNHYPVVSTIKDLKVHLVKINTFNILHNYEAFKYAGGENSGTLTFSTVDPSDYQNLGSFKIDFENNYVHNPVESNISSGYSIKVSEGETSSEISGDFNWNWDSNQDTSVSGWMGHKYNAAGAYIKLFYLQVYNLWLSTTRFYYPNGLSPASGITFDPDLSTPTLTYNYGDDSYHVYSGLSELTLKIGCNNESNQANYRMRAVSFGKPESVEATIAEKGNLILAKDDSEGEFRFLGDGTNPVISGFTSVTYDDFTILSDGAKYDTDKKQLVDAEGQAMTSAIFVSNLNIAKPTFESSSSEGVTWVSLQNNNSYPTEGSQDIPFGTIKYSIVYADGSEGVTDEIFTEAFTISKPATVTACVTLNGKESANAIGKYFGASKEEYTVAIGDKIMGTSWFIPEIVTGEGGDNISCEFNIQENDNSGIFEREGTGSDSYLVAKKSGTTTVNASLWSGSITSESITVLNSDLIALKFTVGEELSSVFEGNNNYGGLYNDSDTPYAVPEGMTAYLVTGISEDGTSVATQDIGYLPARTAVLLLKGEGAKAITKIPYEGSATVPTNNKFYYSDPNSPATAPTTRSWYVIYNNKFMKVTGGTKVNGGKCYLDLGTTAGTRGFYNIGGGEGTTSLREVKTDGVNNEKWTDGEWYTLQGQRVAKPAKGLYILNGKKVVVK